MKIPFIFNNGQYLPEYIKQRKPYLIKKCIIYGALLFRGFEVSPSIFEESVNAFDMKLTDMRDSAAPRTKISDSIYTANDSPPDSIIPMHHEMAQTKNPPSHVFFYCHQSSKEGGCTPLLDSLALSKYIYNEYPEMYKKLENGIYYSRILSKMDDLNSPIGKGWQTTFLTSNKNYVESQLKKSDIEFEWLLNDELRMRTPLMSAFGTKKLETTENIPAFFNSIIAVYNGWNDARNIGNESILHHDNTYIDPLFMKDINNYVEKNKYKFKWQNGDVLMIDNRITMHSRECFIPPRKLYASIRTLL